MGLDGGSVAGLGWVPAQVLAFPLHNSWMIPNTAVMRTCPQTGSLSKSEDSCRGREGGEEGRISPGRERTEETKSILKKIILSISIYFYVFWLSWVFIAQQAFPSFGEQGLLSSCATWTSHFGGKRAVVAVPGLYRTVSVVLALVDICFVAYMGSSWARDRSRVSCIGRPVRYH